MDPMRRVVIVGDGGWGTALSMVLVCNGREVGLWSYDPEYADLMRETRTNPRFLPGFDIPEAVEISADLDALLPGAELLVSAVPTTYVREVWTVHLGRLRPELPFLSVS